MQLLSTNINLNLNLIFHLKDLPNSIYSYNSNADAVAISLLFSHKVNSNLK